MTLAALTFSALGWRGPVLAVLAVFLVVTALGYRRQPRGWIGFALKALAVALLAWCVLEPQWTGQRPRPGANVVAILADNSEGLGLTDEGAAEPRSAQVRAVLDASTQAWPGTLAETFDVRRYGFDTRLQSLTDFGALRFDGRASALGGSLATLLDRFRGRPLAAVLLVTDGVATDRTVLDALPEGLPPVFPVVIGGKGPARDVALGRVTAAQTAFEDAPVTIDAEVTAFGAAGEMLKIKLVDADNAIVQEQTVPAPEPGRPAAARFQVKPDKPGLVFYRLEVAGDAAKTEATLANNHRVIVVDRGQGPYRILYVTGRPNWEYKFLNRALEGDPQVQLVGLVRVAKREPKFDFRGRAGESSNPLFRGAEDQSREAAGSYDQPVLVRLNTRDELELRSGFPAKAEDLYGWHAVIIDDLESAFFTMDQASLVQKFVSERGAGLLMLGGMESFADGAWARTPIGDMLPVSLDRTVATEQPTAPQKFELDREGWLQPWARLRENEAAERERLATMPTFQVLNRIRDVKPGASVIATVRDAAGGTAPALVVQRFGRGRVGAVTVGDYWRWGMRDGKARVDFEKSWRQLVRWLVADVPGRVSLTAEPTGERVNLQMRVRDPQWRPVDTATVAVTVEGLLGAEGKVTLSAEPSLTEAGLYEATFVPRSTGGWKATAVATNDVGAEEGRAEAGWSTDLAADEFRSLVPDRALLTELARRTGGRVLEPAELDAWTRSLPNEKAPVMETWSQPLWHTPWVFLAALACLVAEWGWRRTHGMA